MCHKHHWLFSCSLIVVLLTVVPVACQDDSVPDDVVVSVAETAVSTPTAQPVFTPTPTFTPSATPTWTKTPVSTSTPTLSPTFTPTPTRFPQLLLTPETPPDEIAYHLVPWSPDHAHNLALLMEGYREAMGAIFNATVVEGIYHSSYRPASLAYAEAFLRYPMEPQSLDWQFGQAENNAISEFDSSSILFETLILDVLNKGEVSVDELPQWFADHALVYSLKIIYLDPLTQFRSSQIITIESGYDYGNASFLLLETDGEFVTYPLFSNLGNYFDSGYEVNSMDLTGDAIPELIISAGIRNGSTSGEISAIFDLSVVPPVQLGFGPENSWALRWSRSTEAVKDENGNPGLQIKSGDVAICPALAISTFQWNGQWFEQVDFEINSDDTLMNFCVYPLEEDRWQWFSEIEKREFLSWVATIADDFWTTGIDNSADVKDEYQYTLAIYHAMLGNYDEAQSLLSQIIDAPSIPESQWVTPAQTFLTHYKSPSDLYRVCVETAVNCNIIDALISTAQTLPANSTEQLLAQLSEIGVPIIKQDTFDFDADRLPEQWFISRHYPGPQFELWMVAQTDSGAKLLFVDYVTTTSLQLHIHTQLHAGFPLSAYIPFTIGNDEIYAFFRRNNDQMPYVVKLDSFEPSIYPSSPEFRALLNAVDALLAGADPQEAVTQFQAIEDSSDFVPDDFYYYYLGLAYELLGDEANAVNAYLLAWQDCCYDWGYVNELVTANPYAIMARAKLAPVP